MEDRVRCLEQSLRAAETSADQTRDEADMLREQLQRSKDDKRALAAEHERDTAARRDLELRVAQLTRSRDADRVLIRDLEASLIKEQSLAHVSKLRADQLDSAINGAEANAEWFRAQLESKTDKVRAQIRSFIAQNADLEAKLDQAQVERDTLRRQANTLTASYNNSQKLLEAEQARARALQTQLEAAEADNAYGGSSIMLQRSIQALQDEKQASLSQEKHLRDKISEVCSAYNDACDRLDAQESQLCSATAKNTEYAQRIEKLETETAQKSNAIARLGAQIQFLLINAQLAEDAEPLLTPDEKLELSRALAIEPPLGSAMQVVHSRLLNFRNVAELQAQNELQLRALDRLTEKCEGYEEQESVENATVAEAKKAILALNARVKELQAERDLLRSLQRSQTTPPSSTGSASTSGSAGAVVGTAAGAGAGAGTGTAAAAGAAAGTSAALEHRITCLETDLDLARNTAADLQSQLTTVVESSANATQRAALLAQDLEATREVAEQLRAQASRAESQSTLWKIQIETHVQEMERLINGREELNKELAAARARADDRDTLLVSTQHTLLDQVNSLKSEATALRHTISESEARIKLAASQRELAAKNAEAYKNQAAQGKLAYENLEQRYAALEKELKEVQERLRLRTISFTTADSDKAYQLEQKLEQTEAQIQDLRTLASDTQKELDANARAFEAQREDLQQQLASTTSSLESVSKELETLKNTPPDTTALEAATKELADSKEQLEEAKRESEATIAAIESKSKTEKENLTLQISQSSSKVDALAAQVASLESQNKQLAQAAEASNASHGESIATLQKERDSLNLTVTALRAEISELSSYKDMVLKDATVKQEASESMDMSTDTPQDQSSLVNTLRRENLIATSLLQSSDSKVHDLELQTKSLQETLSKTESELHQLSMSAGSGLNPEVATKLENSNTELVNQLKETTQQRDLLQTQLDQSQEALQAAEAKVRDAETQVATTKQELELLEKDRDLWKSRLGASSDDQITAIQSQLDQKQAELAASKQEYTTKLTQESEKTRLSMAEVKQLNLKINELSAAAALNTKELATKDKRIAHLENEINRISDELTEEEQKKKTLAAQLTSITAKFTQVQSNLKTVEAAANQAKASGAAEAAAAEKVKKLEQELAAANAQIESLKSTQIQVTETNVPATTSEEVKKAVDALAAKASAEEVDALKTLIESSTQNRLKPKFLELLRQKTEAAAEQAEKKQALLVQERDSLLVQLKEAQASTAEIEATTVKRVNMRIKMLESQVQKLKAQLAEAAATVVQTPTPAASGVASGAQPKRPQVQRSGTKQQNNNNNNNNKRKGQKDDNDINKRLRDS